MALVRFAVLSLLLLNNWCIYVHTMCYVYSCGFIAACTSTYSTCLNLNDLSLSCSYSPCNAWQVSDHNFSKQLTLGQDYQSECQGHGGQRIYIVLINFQIVYSLLHVSSWSTINWFKLFHVYLMNSFTLTAACRLCFFILSLILSYYVLVNWSILQKIYHQSCMLLNPGVP